MKDITTPMDRFANWFRAALLCVFAILAAGGYFKECGCISQTHGIYLGIVGGALIVLVGAVLLWRERVYQKEEAALREEFRKRFGDGSEQQQ